MMMMVVFCDYDDNGGDGADDVNYDNDFGHNNECN